MVDVGGQQNGAQQAGLVVREGFAGAEQLQLAELSARAAAEQARAMVEARYVMALKRPRDMDKVRVSLLKDCGRTEFAKSARFAKPIGKTKVRGWSVRFAEAAARMMGNLAVEQVALYDDAVKRILRIAVTDLETNTNAWKDITIEKKVERSSAAGRTVLGKRINSEGQPVYIVEATEDDFFNKESAIASKVRRQLVLQFIPGDILDECLDAVMKTLAADDKKDPDAARKKVIDAFASVGVLPDQLAEYLGHPLAQVQPAELEDLREAYAALRDGEATWKELLEAAVAERAPTTAPAAAPSSGPTPATSTGKLAQRIRAQKEATPSPAPQPASPPDAGDTPEPPPQKESPPSPPKEEAPAPSSTPAAASGGDEKLTEDASREFKAQMQALQAELIALVGREKAQAEWNGGNNAVKTLKGVRTRAHADERLEQANTLVELAKLSAEIAGARKEVLDKVQGGELLIRQRAPDAVKNTLSLTVAAARGALDTLLTILEEHAPANAGDDLPWDKSQDAPEPGSNG